MKKLLLLAVIATFTVSCEKEPDVDKLDSDLAVYTNYDSEINFDKFSTYYLPDSILLAGSIKSEYWADDNALKIISQAAKKMEDMGYTRTVDKTKASLGLQIAYVQQTTYIQGIMGSPYWWGAGFWGPFWNSWYYPYPISYSYDTGTLMMEMVDLTNKPTEATSPASLPVIWHTYASGLLYGNSRINIQLMLRAISQAFNQSPYIQVKH